MSGTQTSNWSMEESSNTASFRVSNRRLNREVRDMFSRKAVAVLLTIAAISLLLGGPVIAKYSYYPTISGPTSYSFVPNGHYVKVCDVTFRDGDAYARFNSGARGNPDGRITDRNGSRRGCGVTNYKSVIYWHDVCQPGQSLGPCVDRSYH